MEEKKKAMISQPMAGLSADEITERRERAAEALEAMGYEVEDTVFDFEQAMLDELRVANEAVYYFSASIEAMSMCDAVCFLDGFEKARGCRLEHEVAVAYGIEVLYEHEVVRDE